MKTISLPDQHHNLHQNQIITLDILTTKKSGSRTSMNFLQVITAEMEVSLRTLPRSSYSEKKGHR